MEQQDYRVTITSNIPAREATDKISRVAEWWTRGFTGRADKKGDRFTVRFGDTFVDFEVIEVVSGKRVAWKVTDCDLPWLKDRKEWNDTEVVFEVSAHDGNTRIAMTHVGLRPKVECYTMCEEGWNFYIGQSLLKFLNTGHGLPDRRPGARR